MYPTAVVRLSGNVFDEGQVYLKQNATVYYCDDVLPNVYSAWEPVVFERRCGEVDAARATFCSWGVFLCVLLGRRLMGVF